MDPKLAKTALMGVSMMVGTIILYQVYSPSSYLNKGASKNDILGIERNQIGSSLPHTSAKSKILGNAATSNDLKNNLPLK